MPTPSPPNAPSFAALLAKYPSTHPHRPRPGTSDCDCTFRFTTAPGLVAARRHPSGEASTAAGSPPPAAQTGEHGYLTHPELVRLVQWKIHHGSYFASLPKLAASNGADAVRRVTGEAFAILASASCPPPHPSHTPSTSSALADAPLDTEQRTPTTMAALACLTHGLRGVGPATASLLLSVADGGATVPFFADELFVWARRGFHLDTPLPLLVPKKAGVKIRYSAKEYEELLAATWEGLRRLRGEGEGEGERVVRASEVEMVARVLGVLGREDGEGGLGGDGKVVDDGEESASTQSKKRKRAAPSSVSPPLPAKGSRLKQTAPARARPIKAGDTASTQRRVMPRRATRRD